MSDLLLGFSEIFTWGALLAILAGTVTGYFIGAMPGLTPTIGIALLIPFTYDMEPVSAICMLVSLYMAAEYGGGITAILVNTPGTPAAAATALDGYPLAQQGKARKALGMSMISSAVGAFISTILLILLALPLARIALRFGAPEYFALAIFGLSVVAGLSSKNMMKGLMAVGLGLLLTTVGMDPITGTFRYTVSYHFLTGVPFIPAMIGLFAISEVFFLITEKNKNKNKVEKIDGALPSVQELKECTPATIKGTLIGFFVGMMPAAGANVACWISYNSAKQSARGEAKALFGKGSLPGIAAAESSNNSCVCGALVPMLALGIPGSSSAAVLIGALTLHGMQCGPLLFTKNPEIPYSIFATLLITVPIMLYMGLAGTKLFAKVTLIPDNILAAMILGTCIIGAYAITGTIFSVWIAFTFGIIGYFLRILEFPMPPVVLGLVLGNMAEKNFRLAMLMGNGSAEIFITRPFTIAIIILTAITFLFPLIKNKLVKD